MGGASVQAVELFFALPWSASLAWVLIEEHRLTLPKGCSSCPFSILYSMGPRTTPLPLSKDYGLGKIGGGKDVGSNFLIASGRLLGLLWNILV